MLQLKKITANKFDYLVLALAIVLAIALMFFADQSGQAGVLQGASLEIIGRLAEPFASLGRWRNVYQENSMLRHQNAMLQIRNSQLAEAHYENMRLREMVGFAQASQVRLMPARLIGSSNQSGMATIMLNLGHDQGVRIDMPVVSADGLVGKVIRTTADYSVVQLLTDRNFRVAALDQRSRVMGMFQWTGFDSGLLTGVSLSADVRVGDWIVTSGQNSLFPTGLKIGLVSMIDDAHAGLFQKIYVKPRLDFSRLEEVFIMTPTVKPKAGG